MIALLGTALLTLFVYWGATTSPRRSFSWGMYSGSTKGFLWIVTVDGPRVPSHEEVRLAPDGHFLTLPDLGLLADRQPTPLRGLIIGAQGNWLVAPVQDGPLLVATPLPDGTELEHLAAALRGFSCR